MECLQKVRYRLVNAALVDHHGRTQIVVREIITSRNLECVFPESPAGFPILKLVTRHKHAGQNDQRAHGS